MKRAGKFWVPDEEQIQLDALAQGGWQLDHLMHALRHVKTFGVAVDGGAHVGSWTIAMAQRFEHVIAFEPSPKTYECLDANVRQWAAEHPTSDAMIELHKFALGEREEVKGMGEDGKYSNGGNTGGRYLCADRNGSIKVRTLDSFELPECHFVKLDVEGYELYALRGAKQTIERFRPVIQIEVKHRMAARYRLDADRAGHFLRKRGMTMIDKIGSDEIYSWL